jgi:hypothetical protein
MINDATRNLAIVSDGMNNQRQETKHAPNSRRGTSILQVRQVLFSEDHLLMYHTRWTSLKVCGDGFDKNIL